MGTVDLLRAAVVARRYFLDGRTKTEIADELGLSRFKVARLIELAMAEGVVRVEINAPHGVDTALGQRLRERYGLTQAWVVDVPHDQIVAELGRVAAMVLADLVTADDVLGISWGRTMRAVVDALPTLPPCPVVQVAGGLPDRLGDGAVELVRRIADLTGGPAYPLHAPLFVTEQGVADQLRAEPVLTQTFAMFARLTVVAMGIGNETSPVAMTLPQPASVTAEMCGLLIADNGAVLRTPATTMALSREELSHTRHVLAVAGGPDKSPAVAAALRTGLISHLVTDRSAAEEALL